MASAPVFLGGTDVAPRRISMRRVSRPPIAPIRHTLAAPDGYAESMRALSTIKYVRPTEFREWVVAITVLGTFLAAETFGLPAYTTPLGFALGLWFGLRILTNLLFMSAGRRALLIHHDWTIWSVSYGICGILIVAALAGMVFGSEAAALRIWCVSMGVYGLTSLYQSQDPRLISDEAVAFDISSHTVRRWRLLSAFQSAVIILTAYGLFLTSGPFAAILFISFGVLVISFLIRWIAVLAAWSEDEA